MSISVPRIVAYDPKTGAALPHPEENIPDLVANGQAALQKGQTIPVISPSGVKSQIPSEEAHEAFQAGYKIQPLDARYQDQLQAQYGDLPHEVIAGLAGAARGLSLGTSDYGLTKTGLVNPETLQNLQEADPVSSIGGDIVGSAIPAILSSGETALASAAAEGRETGAITEALAKAAQSPIGKAIQYSPAGLVSKAGHAASEATTGLLGLDASQSLATRIAKTAVIRGAGSALEGAMFSGGNDVSEAALGDPNEVAHHALADIGLGSLIGGAFGVTAEGFGAGLKKLFPRVVTNEAADSAVKSQTLEGAQGPSEPQPAQGNDIPMDGSTPSESPAQAPQSLDEVSQLAGQIRAGGGSSELPQAAVVKNAESLIAGDVKYPLNQAQVGMLENPEKYAAYQTLKVSDSPLGNDILTLEAAQKAERVDLLNKTVSDLSPSGAPTSDPTRAGEKAVSAFTDQYQAEQKQLGKLFSKFDDLAPNTPVKSLDVIEAVKKSIPDADKVLKVVDGAIQLQPYSAAEMGFGKETYNAIAHIFKPMTEGELTVQGLRNLRNSLDDYVTAAPGNKNYATQVRNVGGLKSQLLEMMGDRIHAVAPELNAPDFFKRYAINESNRSVMEKLFGGSISEGAGMLKKIPLERVGDSIFRSSVTINAAKQVLGEKAFNELLSDWMSEQIEKRTDKGVFSSNKFGTFLKSNSAELAHSFEGKSDQLARLHALTDSMRILPDAPPINPSNTAPTAQRLAKIAAAGRTLQHPEALPGKILEWIGNHFDQGAQRAAVDAELSGRVSGAAATADGISSKEAQYGVLKRIESAAKRSAETVSSSVESFIKNNKAASIAIPAATLSITAASNRNNPYHHIIDKAADVQTYPEKMVDDMGNATARLAQHAPNIAQNMSSIGTQAAMFLASKAPKDPNMGNTLTPGVHNWQPSQADTLKFKRYADAIYHPLSVLEHVKDNTLSSEEVETIQTVYPQLYKQIATEMVNQLTDLKKPLTYSKRLTVSRLLGVPYDSSMQPQMIQALQAAHGSAQSQEQLHNGSSGLNQKGLSKIDKANNAMTDTQRVQTRSNG